MPTLQASDIADIAVSTLRNLGRLRVTDAISPYQNTIVFKRLWRKGKMEFSGDQSQFNLMIDENHSARGVGLYYTQNITPNNVLTNAVMPWRHAHWNWGIDHREIAMNAGNENKIVDILKVQRWAALASGILYMEKKGWQVATPTDPDFVGIPYWIVKSNTATTTNEGFNGNTPSGYSTVAGLTPTATNIAPKWSNYAAQYTTVSKDDLVVKMEVMADMTDFMPLIDELPTYSVGEDQGFYLNRPTRQSLKALLEAQNDDLGFDLDPTNGHMMFRRGPCTWVKQLDYDTTNPVYSINWGDFHFMGLRGWMMREKVFDTLPNQPTVMACFTDTSLNTYCTNRRRQGVLSTDTTMPSLQ